MVDLALAPVLKISCLSGSGRVDLASSPGKIILLFP